MYISNPLDLFLQSNDPMGEGTDVVVVGVATKSQEVAEQMQLYRAGIFNGQVGFGGADVVI